MPMGPGESCGSGGGVLSALQVSGAKKDQMLNKCQAAEILEESWFVNSTGPQRQYFVTWHPSIVTSARLKHVSDKFQVESSTEDRAYHFGLYDPSWEVADELDRDREDLVQEWMKFCKETGITTPVPPPTPTKPMPRKSRLKTDSSTKSGASSAASAASVSRKRKSASLSTSQTHTPPTQTPLVNEAREQRRIRRATAAETLHEGAP